MLPTALSSSLPVNVPVAAAEAGNGVFKEGVWSNISSSNGFFVRFSVLEPVRGADSRLAECLRNLAGVGLGVASVGSKEGSYNVARSLTDLGIEDRGGSVRGRGWQGQSYNLERFIKWSASKANR